MSKAIVSQEFWSNLEFNQNWSDLCSSSFKTEMNSFDKGKEQQATQHNHCYNDKLTGEYLNEILRTFTYMWQFESCKWHSDQ